jgi:ABC-type multidrug transport system fused ATPase/permease subunit
VLAVAFFTSAARWRLGAVTIGTAIAFIQYAQRFFRPIQDLSDKYNILQAAMASAERIFKLLDTPVAIADPPRPASADQQGRIEFRDMSFAYRDNHRVIEKVSSRSGPAETVTVIDPRGPNHADNLLLRFYDLQEGEILFDGVNIRDLPARPASEFRFGFRPFLLRGLSRATFAGNERYFHRANAGGRAPGQYLDFIETLPAGLTSR